VDSDVPDGMVLQEHVRSEAVRELREEVGVIVEEDDFDFTLLLTDDSDPVGRVHLGLVAFIRVTEDQVKEMEPGIVDRGGFEDKFTMRDKLAWRMENWSQIVLTSIL
jgi:predicted NUDIX family phosphoesterase